MLFHLQQSRYPVINDKHHIEVVYFLWDTVYRIETHCKHEPRPFRPDPAFAKLSMCQEWLWETFLVVSVLQDALSVSPSRQYLRLSATASLNYGTKEIVPEINIATYRSDISLVRFSPPSHALRTSAHLERFSW
jgi:hypothetical protein